MAKKDKKKSKKKDNPGADAVGAVRTAVERTFQATADSAQSTRTRAQDLVDEVAGAAARVREMIEQVGVLEDLKGLRGEVEKLARRVAALEGGSKPAASKPASSKPASSSAARAARGAQTAGSRPPASPPPGSLPRASRRPRARSRRRRRRARPLKPAASRTRQPATRAAAKKPPDGRSRVRLPQGVPDGDRPDLHDDERGPRHGARARGRRRARSASSSTTSTSSSTSAPARATRATCTGSGPTTSTGSPR